MPYATGTVVGHFTGIDGDPSSGGVLISPTVAVLLDDTDNVILSGSVWVKLENGEFTIELPATDDATLNPTGFGYTATVTLSSGRKFGPVSFALPGGDTVDLVDLIPADAGSFDPTVTYVSAADLLAETNARIAADALKADAAATTTALGLKADATALTAEAAARLTAQRTYGDLIPVGIGATPIAQSTTSTTSGTGRGGVLIGRAITDIVLDYGNQWIDATSTVKDQDGVGDLVFESGLEVNGTIYKCTFAGRTQTTNGPGGVMSTDPLPVDIPAGTIVYPRTFIVSGTWYFGRIAVAPGVGGFTATSNLTTPGSAAIADAASFTGIPMPAVVRGRPTGTDRRALVSFGDSIAAGAGDGPETRPSVNTVTERLGAAGYIGRLAALAGVGLATNGTGSDQAQFFASLVNRFRRLQFVRYGTTAIVNYGRNDISSARTVAQVQADVITIWNLANNRKMRVLAATVTPRTTTTDGYLTTGNQTAVSNEANRVTYNTWLRDGAPMVNGAAVATGTSGADRAAVYNTAGAVVSAANGTHPLYAVIEVADIVESGRNTGLWAAPTVLRTLSDGIVTASGSLLNSATGAFTSNDVGRGVIIPGAGAAGATYVGIIKSINTGTQANLVTPTTTAVNPATVRIADISTSDGLHPGATMHKAIAASIPTALIA